MKYLSQKIRVAILVIIADMFDPALPLQASVHEDKKWTRHLNDRSNSSLCGSESWHATGRLRDRYGEEKTRISQQATAVNRLSQDLRQEINRTTILKIAAQITEQIKELTCASPKDLSLLANGFSRLKGKPRQIPAKALKAIADEISKRQTRLTEVQGCHKHWRCWPTGSTGSAAASRG